MTDDEEQTTLRNHPHGAGLTTESLREAMRIMRTADTRPFGHNTLWVMNRSTYVQVLALGMPSSERVFVATIERPDGTSYDLFPDGTILAVDDRLFPFPRQDISLSLEEQRASMTYSEFMSRYTGRFDLP